MQRDLLFAFLRQFDRQFFHLTPCEHVFLVDVLALGDVIKAIDCTSDVTGRVLKGSDVDQGDAARAIGSLDDHFLVYDRNPIMQDVRHGTFVVRKQITVRSVQAISAAEAVSRIAEQGRAAPKVSGASVEAENRAIGRADVDSRREQIQQLVSEIWRRPRIRR